MSAANGDVRNCRLILEKERLLKICKELPEESIVTRYGVAQSFATENQNFVHNTTDEENILTNFVSSGHSSLQAASQNGHVDVCRVLISEFGADIEFQVRKVIKAYFI